MPTERSLDRAPGPQQAATPQRRPGRLWDRWLQLALVGVMIYSVTLVVAGRLAGRLFDLLGFGMHDAGIVTGTPQEQHVLLVQGVLGSVLLGWMATLLLIARGPLRSRERWAWTTFTTAFAVWFAVDTTFSLVIGAPTHALFNVAFLLAVAPPLIGLRAQLRPPRPASSSRTRDLEDPRRRMDSRSGHPPRGDTPA